MDLFVSSEPVSPPAASAPHVLPLAAGRSLRLVHGAESDEVQVRSPNGTVEVRIVLTAEGPVVQLQAARLELHGTDEIDLKCRKFSLHTEEETRLTSDGQVRLFAQRQLLMRAKEEIDLKGRPVRTNVKDGRFYDDYTPAVNGKQWGTAFHGMTIPREEAEVGEDAVKPAAAPELAIGALLQQWQQLQQTIAAFGG